MERIFGQVSGREIETASTKKVIERIKGKVESRGAVRRIGNDDTRGEDETKRGSKAQPLLEEEQELPYPIWM